MKAVVHLGNDCQYHLPITMFTDFEKIKQVLGLSQNLILDQKSRNIWRIYNWSECNSMDENYFVERQSRQVVNSKGIRFICFGTFVLAKEMNTHDQCTSWKEKNGVVREVSWIMGDGLYWCGFTTLQLLEESSERWRRITFCLRSSKIDSYSCRCTSTSIWEKSRIQRNSFLEFLRCCCTRQKISWRTLVISRTRNWRTNGTERTSQNQTVCGTMLLICHKYSYRAHVFLMRTLSACLFQLVVTVVLQITVISSRIDSRGSSTTWSFAYCVLPKIVTSHRAMSYVAPHLSITLTLGTCTPSLTRPNSLSSDPLLGELEPCADLGQLERGSLAEPPIPHMNWWWLIPEKKRTSSFQRNQCVVSRSFEKHRRWTLIDTLQCGSSDSSCFASSFPSISSVSTAQWRVVVKNLLWRLQIFLSAVQLKWNGDSESKVAPSDVSILTRSLMFNVGARGTSVQQHQENSKRDLIE